MGNQNFMGERIFVIFLSGKDFLIDFALRTWDGGY